MKVAAITITLWIGLFWTTNLGLARSIIRPPLKWYVIDRLGHVASLGPFESAWNFDHGYALVKKDSRWQFTSPTGKVLGDLKFDDARPFSDGIAVVKCIGETKFRFLTVTGTLVLGEFDKANDFHEGFCVVQCDDHKLLLDKNGKLVLTQFADLNLLVSEGLIGAKDSNGLWGYSNIKGKMVIPARYLSVRNFEGGVAAVQTSNHNWSLITRSGQIVGGEYDDCRPNKDGLIAVAQTLAGQKKKWGVIDRAGQIVLPLKFDLVQYSEGIFCVLENGRYGYLSGNGNPLTEIKFHLANTFREGLAAVSSEERTSVPRYGFIDKTGKFSIAAEFTNVSDGFHHGLSAAAITVAGETKWGFINSHGNWLVKPDFESAGSFSNDGFAVVGSDQSPAYLQFHYGRNYVPSTKNDVFQ